MKEKTDWKKVTYPPAIWFTEELRSLMLKIDQVTIGLLILSYAFFINIIISIFFVGKILLWGGSIAILTIAVFVFLHWERPLRAKMGWWNTAFTRFLHSFRFEMYPPRGATPQEKIFHQLQNVYSEDLGEYISKYQKERFFTFKDFLNVKVSGKKTEHIFDVYISDEILKRKEGKWAKKLKSKLRKHGSIFVKRFDKKEPIGRKELAKLRGETSDVINRTKTRLCAIVVVSTSGFTESAKRYVQNKRNWIKNRSFNLVQERPEGYLTVWISP